MGENWRAKVDDAAGEVLDRARCDAVLLLMLLLQLLEDLLLLLEGGRGLERGANLLAWVAVGLGARHLVREIGLLLVTVVEGGSDGVGVLQLRNGARVGRRVAVNVDPVRRRRRGLLHLVADAGVVIAGGSSGGSVGGGGGGGAAGAASAGAVELLWLLLKGFAGAERG